MKFELNKYLRMFFVIQTIFVGSLGFYACSNLNMFTNWTDGRIASIYNLLVTFSIIFAFLKILHENFCKHNNLANILNQLNFLYSNCLDASQQIRVRRNVFYKTVEVLILTPFICVSFCAIQRINIFQEIFVIILVGALYIWIFLSILPFLQFSSVIENLLISFNQRLEFTLSNEVKDDIDSISILFSKTTTLENKIVQHYSHQLLVNIFLIFVHIIVSCFALLNYVTVAFRGNIYPNVEIVFSILISLLYFIILIKIIIMSFDKIDVQNQKIAENTHKIVSIYVTKFDKLIMDQLN